MIKSVIFDIDGTLLDSSPMWEHLGENYLNKLGIIPREGLSETLYRMSMEEGAEFLRREYALQYSAEEIIRQINRMTEDFYCFEVQPKEGARELLAALRSHFVTMGIATAGDKRLAQAALERLGLAEYFSGMASCAEYGPKTSPEVYFAAAEMIFAIPEETLVFEDALHAVETAKKAGFVTAAVWDMCEPEQEKLKNTADFYAESLSDFAKRVRQLIAAEKA